MSSRSRRHEGIEVRHESVCRSKAGGRCSCSPSYRAKVRDLRSERSIRRTLRSLAEAKSWRTDALAAVRAGTLSGAPVPTLIEAARAWAGVRVSEPDVSCRRDKAEGLMTFTGRGSWNHPGRMGKPANAGFPRSSWTHRPRWLWRPGASAPPPAVGGAMRSRPPWADGASTSAPRPWRVRLAWSSRREPCAAPCGPRAWPCAAPLGPRRSPPRHGRPAGA